MVVRVAQRFDPAVWRHGLGDDSGVAFLAHDAVMLGRNQGKLLWRVRAAELVARHVPGDDIDSLTGADLIGLRDGLLCREGRAEARFVAGRATYDQPTGRLDISGGMAMRSLRGDRILAPRCIWSEREDFARFPDGARGKMRGVPIRAPVVMYNPRRNLLQCPQGASAILEGRRLQAGWLNWDIGMERIDCGGGIEGQRKSMTYTADHATLDLHARTVRANKVKMRLRIEDGASPLEARL